MVYDFYLDKCLLPVTPSKLSLKINNANKTLTLINEREIIQTITYKNEAGKPHK